jgi:hypothetical protein
LTSTKRPERKAGDTASGVLCDQYTPCTPEKTRESFPILRNYACLSLSFSPYSKQLLRAQPLPSKGQGQELNNFLDKVFKGNRHE